MRASSTRRSTSQAQAVAMIIAGKETWRMKDPSSRSEPVSWQANRDAAATSGNADHCRGAASPRMAAPVTAIAAATGAFRRPRPIPSRMPATKGICTPADTTHSTASRIARAVSVSPQRNAGISGRAFAATISIARPDAEYHQLARNSEAKRPRARSGAASESSPALRGTGRASAMGTTVEQ